METKKETPEETYKRVVEEAGFVPFAIIDSTEFKICELYHQQRTKHALPTSEDRLKIFSLYKLARGVEFQQGEREGFVAGFKAALGLITKEKTTE